MEKKDNEAHWIPLSDGIIKNVLPLESWFLRNEFRTFFSLSSPETETGGRTIIGRNGGVAEVPDFKGATRGSIPAETCLKSPPC